MVPARTWEEGRWEGEISKKVRKERRFKESVAENREKKWKSERRER